MKRFIAYFAFAITAGLLFAALGTFVGAVFNDTFISSSYAAKKECENNYCNDLQCAYTYKSRTCRILNTGECATGRC